MTSWNTKLLSNINKYTRNEVECPTCFRRFRLPIDLNRHYKMKHGDSPDKENICSGRNKLYNYNSHEMVSKSQFDQLQFQFDILLKEKDNILMEKNIVSNDFDRFKSRFDKTDEERKKLLDEKRRLESKLRTVEWERDELKEKNYDLRKKVNASANPARLEAARNAERDQIQLVGSKVVYDRVNEKLGEKIVDPYFVNEQFLLYRWRREFFYKNFDDAMWYTEYGGDSRSFDTIPYQITQHFDHVVAMLSLPDTEMPVYFACDESESQVSFFLDTYENTDRGLPWAVGQLWDMSDLDLREMGITFSQAVHMIVEKCANGPKRLEHLAMKTVLAHNISIDELAKTLQLKAKDGMFTEYAPAPDGLSPEGRFRYEVLKMHFEIDDGDFQYEFDDRDQPKYEAMFPKENPSE